MHDAEPDVEPAAHPARVRPGRTIGRGRQVEDLEHLDRASRRGRLVHAVEPALEDELAATGLGRVGGPALRHVPDAPADLLRVPGEIDAGDGGLPARRQEEGREHPQGRGLAGPVGSEEPEDLARPDVQVHAPHGLDGAAARLEGPTQSLRLDHRPAGARRGRHRIAPAVPYAGSRPLARFAHVGHYLRSADIHPHRGTCQHGQTTGHRRRRPGPSTRQLPGLDLRPDHRDPAGPLGVRHRCPRAVDRHGRGHRRQAVGGHGPHLGCGHAGRGPARAGGLRPAGHRPGRPPAGRHRGRPGARGDHRVTARFARAGGRRRGRPLLPGAAGDDQRLPLADGRPDPGRVGPPANADRGRRLRADRPGRALGAAGRSLERTPDVPLGRAGAAAPVRPLGRGALPGPLRRGDAAGPGP